MIKKAKAADVRIVFNDEALTAFLVAFNGAVIVNKGHQINRNVDGNITDALSNFSNFSTTMRTILWWSLEFCPFPRSYQDPRTKHWHRTYT